MELGISLGEGVLGDEDAEFEFNLVKLINSLRSSKSKTTSTQEM